MSTRTQLSRLTIASILIFGYTPMAFAQGDVIVQPGDPGGDLYSAPAIDLGANSPSRPGMPSAFKPGASGSDAPGRSQDPPSLLGSQQLPTWCQGPLIKGRCPGRYAPPAQATGEPGAVSPDPAVLARQAAKRLRLPLPTPQHSPDLRLRDGRPATVVGEYTWFWTNREDWRPHRDRVQAGAVWAEVTAVPVRLSMSPGNGQPVESCAGPGTPYDRSFGMHAPSPDCDVVYLRSSIDQPGEQVTAEWSITWRVLWRGFNGTASVAGELSPMTSRTQTRFAVAEAQALRTR